MNGYDTLMELRKMYREKDKEYTKTSEVLTEMKETDGDYKWIERHVHACICERDCIQDVARKLFPDLDVDFWRELY